MLSPHKFLGGPGSSGLLVARAELFATRTPERPGGGTVDYVGSVELETVDYVSDLAVREEGGTPAIVSDLRAGAAFLVKSLVGADVILEHEKELAAHTVQRLARHPKIQVLGPATADRLGIISFVIEGLHHDLASGLLDNLFGVQSRSGCACAGPYGHRLLGLDETRSALFRTMVSRGLAGLKPGWVRLSLPYYASREDIEFLLQAVEFVAEHGEVFASDYTFHWESGVWRHRTNDVSAERPLELSAAALLAELHGESPAQLEVPLSPEQLAAERAGYFTAAEREVARLEAQMRAEPPTWNPSSGDPDVDAMVGFRNQHAMPLPRG